MISVKVLYWLVLLVIVTVLTLRIIAWLPVVDRLIRWCDYYPNSLEECKE